MEDRDVHLRDIEALRNNAAWRWLNQEWSAILEELQQTLVGEDFPAIYRTQGRASGIMHILASLDSLEEAIREISSGNE